MVTSPSNSPPSGTLRLRWNKLRLRCKICTPTASRAVTARRFSARRDASQLRGCLRASMEAAITAISLSIYGLSVSIIFARVWRGTIPFERCGKKQLVQFA